MKRVQNHLLAVLAVCTLLVTIAGPAAAQYPRGKCFGGTWQVRIDYSDSTTYWQCSDNLRFGTVNLNSLCFADSGTWDPEEAVGTVTRIEFDHFVIPTGAFAVEGGPFSGALYVDRNGSGGSLAGSFHGPATDGMDDDGIGPENGSFIGFQLSCLIMGRTDDADLGTWKRVLP